MKACVTGAAGFIGGNIVKALIKNNHRIIMLWARAFWCTMANP